MKRELEPQFFLRTINNGPVAIIGSRGENGYNACVVAWTSPASKSPPSLALFLSSGHLSWENIAQQKSFTVNIPDKALARHAAYLGGVSGRAVPDKLAVCGMESIQAKFADAPIFPACIANLECRVLSMDPETHLVLGEVVYALAEETLFYDHWRLEQGRYPLHHLGGEYYQCGSEKLVQPRLQAWVQT